jgi:serine/threonine-protein kinase RsbW
MKRLVENNSTLLKELSRSLIKSLEEKGVDDNIIFDIHVSFEEALRNAMIHGNKLNPKKRVTVETDFTETEVIVSVEDEGEGFNPGEVPDPTLDENLLKESGRGVYLIRHLMDEVRYEKNGRKIVMIKRFGKREK